jgi:hypothetical protein
MTGQQIYENFATAKGTDSLMDAATTLATIRNTYNDRADQIKALALGMESGWTGDAAGAAQRGAGPLAVSHAGAAQELSTGMDLLIAQSQTFHETKNKVTPVPPAPSEPSTFHNVVTFGGARSDYEDGVAKTNAASQTNVAAMQGWTTASSYNGTMMPTTFSQLDPNAMNVALTPSPGGTAVIQGGPGGGSGRHTGGSPNNGGSGSHAAVGGPGGSGPSAGRNGPGGSGPGGSGGSGPGRGTGDSTTPGGYTPLPTSGGGIGSGWPGSTSSDTSSGGPASNSGSFSGALGAGGFGSGGGSGGSSAGGALGGKGSLSGGNSSGAGAVEGESAGRGASGPGSAAGAKGAAGQPGMGAGGKGKDKEEDKEHDRKYVMDDDSAFQLSENGERIVDPRTGMSVAPPVIGN